MKAQLLAGLLFLTAAAPEPGLAVEPDEVLANPVLESRARDISRELRCIVCQSESIDDSNAPLAKDLRLLVRDRLKEGDTDQEVIAFVVARYGDYVLLKPPLQKNTLLLWGAPALFALVAGGAFFGVVSRRTKATAPADLTESEQSDIDEMLR